MQPSHPSLYNTLSLIKLFGACLVMTTHLGGQYWGLHFYSFGTGCFFVVSGFYALNWRREHGPGYLGRRLLRLCPAFFAAVLIYSLSRDIPWSQLPTLLWHHATFFLAGASRDQVFALNPAFWSLPVFVTFFMLVSLLPQHFRPHWAQLFLLLPLPLLAELAGLHQWRGGYLLLWAAPFYLYAFWLGGLCQQCLRKSTQYAEIQVLILALLILLCGASHASFTSWLPTAPAFSWQLLMVLLYTLLLRALLHSRFTRGRRPVLAKLGELSFGLYLFHNLPTHWLPDSLPPSTATLATLALTLLLAAGSRRFIECPLLQRARQ